MDFYGFLGGGICLGLPICLFDCLNGWVCLVCWCVGVKKKGGGGLPKLLVLVCVGLGFRRALGFRVLNQRLWSRGCFRRGRSGEIFSSTAWVVGMGAWVMSAAMISAHKGAKL